MKNLSDPALVKYRDHAADRQRGVPDNEREWGGAFLVPYIGADARKRFIRVIASRGDPADPDELQRWDHLSASLADRCPTWEEMEFLKRLFFKPQETAMQLHVPTSAHISNHPYCLHIWRPLDVEIPRPPDILVGLGDMSGGALPGLGQ